MADPIDPDAMASRLLDDAAQLSAGWGQADLALGGRPFDVVAAPLSELVARGMQSGAIDRWFFVRKPPGIRVRVHRTSSDDSPAGAPTRATARSDVITSLDELAQREVVATVRRSPYEPEAHRFGGPAGLDLAHRLFWADSEAALAFESLAASRPEALGDCTRQRFSLLLTNDLLGRAVDDGAELWDVWMRLHTILSGVAVASAPEIDARARVDAEASMPADLAPLIPSPLHETVARAQAANDEVARSLRSVTLTVGRRAWLGAVVIFHWNRFGLSTDDLVPMARAMSLVLDGDAAPGPGASRENS